MLVNLQFRLLCDGTIVLVPALAILSGGERILVSWFVKSRTAQTLLCSAPTLTSTFAYFYGIPWERMAGPVMAMSGNDHLLYKLARTAARHHPPLKAA
jgi:hypothetical protein